jgi:hypothetical protein
VIDPPVTDWVGHDFANNIRDFEGDTVFWFSQNWTPVLVYFFVIMYIAVYPFLLWFSPFYFLKTDNKKPMKALAYGSLFIYIGAIPFELRVEDAIGNPNKLLKTKLGKKMAELPDVNIYPFSEDQLLY